jgi:hypothetical protein
MLPDADFATIDGATGTRCYNMCDPGLLLHNDMCEQGPCNAQEQQGLTRGK